METIESLKRKGVEFEKQGEDLILKRVPTTWKGTFEIPDGVTEIGIGAFSGCKSLEKINIPESVTKIGGGAFVGCFSLKVIYTLDKNFKETLKQYKDESWFELLRYKDEKVYVPKTDLLRKGDNGKDLREIEADVKKKKQEALAELMKKRKQLEQDQRLE